LILSLGGAPNIEGGQRRTRQFVTMSCSACFLLRETRTLEIPGSGAERCVVVAEIDFVCCADAALGSVSHPSARKTSLPRKDESLSIYFSLFLVGTSGRGSGIKPSRFGILTFGRVFAFSSAFSSTIPFKYRMNAVTA
jgi:hypothetical protein